MTATRSDLLNECIPQGLPYDAFKEAWCARCVNPECVRSQTGHSKFENRIADWEEKLFKNPPVMALDDPLYVAIVGKKFITIDPGRTPEIRSPWIDPKDLKEPEPDPEPQADVHVPEPQAVPVPQVPDEAVVLEPVVEAREPSPPKPKPSPRSTLSLLGQNAPDQSGRVLLGPSGAPTTKADPWAPPDPPDPADVVVQPGARIKMGRSGV
jgi:hypothetical protein